MNSPFRLARLARPFVFLLITLASVGLLGCASGAQTASAVDVEPAAETPSSEVQGEGAAETETVVPAEVDESDEPAAPAEAEGEATPEGQGERASALDSLEPPDDGEWLVDAETGNRYYIDKVRKVEGRYTRLEDGVVRVRNLMPIQVEREDEDYFYFRVYDFPSVEESRRGPSEGERAEVRAEFQAEEVPTVDRLKAVSFGEGLPARGQWRNGFDLADMNGDGHLDIVHGPYRKGPRVPQVFLGDGAGSWRPWAADYPPLPYDYGDAAAADFDGDGRQDIALAMHMTGIVVLVRDEDDSFRRWTDSLKLRGEEGGEGAFTSRTLVDVDWNGDGRPDLLALAEGPVRPGALMRETRLAEEVEGAGSLALLNQGDGLRIRAGSGTDPGFGDAVAVADFNADGLLDFVTATSLIGYRDILKIGLADGGWESVPLEGLRDKALVWSVVAEDFDADGRPDLALSYFTNRGGDVYEGIDLFYNRGSDGLEWERVPLVAHSVEILLDGSYPRYRVLAAGDLDGDGHLDLAALQDDGDVDLFLGQPGGGFSLELSPELNDEGVDRAGCSGYHAVLTDLNGDGRDEIVAGFAGEPGSEQFGRAAAKYCSTRGSLEAWSFEPGAEGRRE